MNMYFIVGLLLLPCQVVSTTLGRFPSEIMLKPPRSSKWASGSLLNLERLNHKTAVPCFNIIERVQYYACLGDQGLVRLFDLSSQIGPAFSAGDPQVCDSFGDAFHGSSATQESRRADAKRKKAFTVRAVVNTLRRGGRR